MNPSRRAGAIAAATLLHAGVLLAAEAPTCRDYASTLLATERENMARRCPLKGAGFVAPQLLESEGHLDWDEVGDYYASLCEASGMTPDTIEFHAERHAGSRREGLEATPDCAPAEGEPARDWRPPAGEAVVVTPAAADDGEPHEVLSPAHTRSELIGYAESLEPLSDSELETMAASIATRAVTSPDPAWESMAQMVREEAARRDAAAAREADAVVGPPPPPASEATEEVLPHETLPDPADEAAAGITLSPMAWSGAWSTSGGVNVTLEVRGDVIEGRYASVQGWPIGTIDRCTLEGRVLRGHWTNASRAPGAVTGLFEWALESDGARFNGKWWTEDGNEHAEWSGSRP